ncbi:hypothetical protein A2209_02550 [Candidatus Roizmanbacteria bacterium RIFOXYA1_FULL_41_12]|uniref:Uncharacterized protein n=1 Tax=Candidatus Roizmanbacteria bacterium RIFOXYA1_FULL_41_12 TaxID=1802082 RepID=A0A1F7K932_9BACT|nr:MAG: hypothetical protein A2209_02550 [Candidatus Roizmanbacteria bacterium RIFOXYA1_FULL_41_12]OGK67617.1 MAG: hypothetical protein A2377_00590 [Candidatus Roizmanbacteria bacterium RIFOXYB1_FULL_41_27]
MLSLSLFFSSIAHDLLNGIKKFLGNNRLVCSVVNFAIERKYAVINRVLKHALDTGNGKNIAFIAF